MISKASERPAKWPRAIMASHKVRLKTSANKIILTLFRLSSKTDINGPGAINHTLRYINIIWLSKYINKTPPPIK